MEIINKKLSDQTGILDSIVEGLGKPQKTLPAKYFYDRRGSQLFEQICTVDEYYPTNTEIKIMQQHIEEISDVIGTDMDLIEFGSGSSSKTRLLLDYLDNLNTYYPVDISGEFLHESVRQLRADYPDLQIIPVIADYTKPFQLPSDSAEIRKVVYFPGSTIGNFVPERAKRFLAEIKKMTDPGGGLLIGVDLKKDRSVLEAAYNDSEGITAEFNKNLLVRINRELDADFDVEKFQHKSFYNEKEGRIEMHLVSTEQQEVHIDQHRFSFQKGETIHTENSYKYSIEEFEKLASGLFNITHVWTDDSELFSVQYLQPHKSN